LVRNSDENNGFLPVILSACSTGVACMWGRNDSTAVVARDFVTILLAYRIREFFLEKFTELIS
jgi:hypothetical protein